MTELDVLLSIADLLADIRLVLTVGLGFVVFLLPWGFLRRRRHGK